MRTGDKSMGQQREQGKQAHPGRSGARNSLGRAVALRFDTQMFAHVLEGRFHLPAAHEAGQDIQGAEVQVGAQQGLRFEFSQHVSYQDEAKRHGRQARVIPDRPGTSNVNTTFGLALPGQAQALPGRIEMSHDLPRRGQALAFLGWTSDAAIGRGSLIQRGIKAQARDNRQRLHHALAGVKKRQRRIRTVGYHYQHPLRQPAPQLTNQLAGQSVIFLGLRPWLS